MPDNNQKKILMLSIVHPDFLPPVLATGQVLRDHGYHVTILTFDSYIPVPTETGENLTIETLGKYKDIGLMASIKMRRKFTIRARQMVADNPIAIISFCPYSFLCGLKIKKNIPLIYSALEVGDFLWSTLLRSPLTRINQLRTIKNIHKADLVCTPSVQRSAWLAGRSHIAKMPYTVLNTSYLTDERTDNELVFKQLLPPSFAGKKIVLYTGSVNDHLCTMELVKAFDLVNDTNSALIITGIRDNEYCRNIKTFIDNSQSADRIKTFPFIARNELIALQDHSDIGVCLAKEYDIDIESKMMAPNKVGEYLAKGMYLLGVKNEYLNPIQWRGVASLAESTSPEDISIALKKALQAVLQPGTKPAINDFVKDYFCMQQQLKPVLSYISSLQAKRKNNA